MPKFYIYSGNLRDILDAKDYKDAIRKSIKKHLNDDNIVVSDRLFISEKGFLIENTKDNEDSLKRHRESVIAMEQYNNKFELGMDTDLFMSLEAVTELCKEFNF